MHLKKHQNGTLEMQSQEGKDKNWGILFRNYCLGMGSEY